MEITIESKSRAVFGSSGGILWPLPVACTEIEEPRSKLQGMRSLFRFKAKGLGMLHL
jgi:hypothetical protein